MAGTRVTAISFGTRTQCVHSRGTRFATNPDEMNREEANWIANQVAWSMSRPSYPAERSIDELARVLNEILESKRRGELSEEDANTAIATVIAADIEKRVEVVLSGIFQQWAHFAPQQMYTAHGVREPGPASVFFPARK